MTEMNVDLRYLVMREKYPIVYKRVRDAVLEGIELQRQATEVWVIIPMPLTVWNDKSNDPAKRKYRTLRNLSDKAFGVFLTTYWNRKWLQSLGERKDIIDNWSKGHP